MNTKKDKAFNSKDQFLAGSGEFTKSTNTFPIVGIGASAGGLEAFIKLKKPFLTTAGWHLF